MMMALRFSRVKTKKAKQKLPQSKQNNNNGEKGKKKPKKIKRVCPPLSCRCFPAVSDFRGPIRQHETESIWKNRMGNPLEKILLTLSYNTTGPVLLLILPPTPAERAQPWCPASLWCVWWLNGPSVKLEKQPPSMAFDRFQQAPPTKTK